ncbi:hypothetical protein ACFVX3_19390 [Rhodococcus erythropolis]
MGDGGMYVGRTRRTDAVVISACAIAMGVVVCAVALIAPWLGEVGNSGGGLCAGRSPWGTPENPPYPGPAGVRAVRWWWPIGVACAGADPETGLNVRVPPKGWGPTVVACLSLALTFLGAFVLAVQLKRPTARL